MTFTPTQFVYKFITVSYGIPAFGKSNTGSRGKSHSGLWVKDINLTYIVQVP